MQTKEGRQGAASCTDCERGRYLKTRDKHPIVTRAEAAKLGYTILAKKFGSRPTFSDEGQSEKPWTSKRCPGIPASIEALCLLVEQGKTDGPGWKFGLEFTGLTEEKLWQIYEQWSIGKKHPMLDRYIESKVTPKIAPQITIL